MTVSLLAVVLISAAILSVAYFTYGTLLSRLIQLNNAAKTPAVEFRDDLDYTPLAPSSLLPQHFSAIAAAGPIVGPIVAGLTFGWLPALLWILVGSVLIGGVHDFLALIASVRHRGRSIAEIVRDYMSGRSYVLFLTFIWIALVYIVVAFTDITAGAFVGAATAANGGVSGPAIATSSLLYLILPIVMGLLMRYANLSLGWATIIFVPLVGVSIWAGRFLPFDVAGLLGVTDPEARKVWDVALLVYCLLAGVAPVWLLLQPRGHLGGYFLYFALGAGMLGLIFGGHTAQYEAFRGFSVETKPGVVQTLFPMLFITIACGACSGFHSLIASGTTSKQLRQESDARPIGYGSMLLEAMVAIVSLSCVMMFAKGSPQLNSNPNQIYANGIGEFMKVLGINPTFAISFALMAFTTFVYDTLDVCTRLGRYILIELTGWKSWAGNLIATGLTAGVPLFFLLRHPLDAPPVWQSFWSLFGASNQLLAALTLLGITIWLWRTRRAAWVWFVAGIPTVWMYTMSGWALWNLTAPRFSNEGKFVLPTDPVPWIGVVLMTLAAFMLVEAIVLLTQLGGKSPPRAVGEPAPA